MTLEDQINNLISLRDNSLIPFLYPIEDWGWNSSVERMVEERIQSKETYNLDDYLEYGSYQALYYLVDKLILEAPLAVCLTSASKYIRKRRLYQDCRR